MKSSREAFPEESPKTSPTAQERADAFSRWSREAGKARQSLFEKTSADVPTLFRPSFDRAWAGTASPRGAIKARCQQCVGHEDTVNRVAECTTYRCVLWAYRPYQIKESSDCTDAAEQTEGETA